MDKFERYSGWFLLSHPHFEDQYARLLNEVNYLIQKHPDDYHQDSQVKLFAHLEKRVFEDIPSDPANPSWRIGNTLGSQNRAWRRAKFGGQYRLFFRFDSKTKIIIYGWANDESTRRAYGSADDAYQVFQRMLEAGKVPNSWEDLLQQSSVIGDTKVLQQKSKNREKI